jgi:hypothetical protein
MSNSRDIEKNHFFFKNKQVQMKKQIERKEKGGKEESPKS